MKGIGLIRVSTSVQDLQQQTDVVKQEMMKDGYTEDNIILIKDKESAVCLSEEERQGLNKMKEYIQNDPSINCVYVFEISRLSRKPEVLYSIRDWLISHKIQLIVLKPYMRLLEDDGKISQTGSIMFGVFGALAEQEGYLRKERCSRGKKKAQLEGKSISHKLPLGYTTDSNKFIIVDEEKANLVRKIFTMCVTENKSTRVIAKELTETGELPVLTTLHGHASTILHILRNTAYIGKAPYNRQRHKENYNQYPKIISDELFDNAQILLNNRKKMPKTSHKNIYYCKGLLKDINSGKVLLPTSCVASYCLVSDKIDVVKHKTVTVPINLFDSFAWHLTIQYNKLNTPENIKKMRNEVLKDISSLTKKIETGKKKIAEYDRQIDKIQERIILGKMKESLGDSMLSDIYSQQEELLDSIAHWEVELFNKSSYWNVTEMIHNVESGKDVSSITDDAERSKLIHEAIKEIIVEKGGIPEKGRIRKRGLGVKYGTMLVKYENGTTEQYKFNSYTKKCFTMDDVEVPYDFVLRIKGLQHRPGFSVKNKEMRDRLKEKKRKVA